MFANGGTVMKTAELWDVGADAPLLRNGSLGSDINAVIRAHGGEGLASANAYAALSPGSQKDVVNFLRVQLIQGKVGEGSGARLPLPPEPTATLTASATAIAPGGPVTLSWTTTDADLGTIDPGIGPVGSSGSIIVSPLSETIFTLTATNRAGPATRSVLVKVVQPPPPLPPLPPLPTATLTASASSIGPGGSVTLSWSTTGADLVTLLPAIGPVSSSGSIVVAPLVTTTYTLTATNPAGSVTSSVRVNVTLPLSPALPGGPMPPP
jgi:hypothetical protein